MGSILDDAEVIDRVLHDSEPSNLEEDGHGEVDTMVVELHNNIVVDRKCWHSLAWNSWGVSLACLLESLIVSTSVPVNDITLTKALVAAHLHYSYMHAIQSLGGQHRKWRMMRVISCTSTEVDTISDSSNQARLTSQIPWNAHVFSWEERLLWFESQSQETRESKCEMLLKFGMWIKAWWDLSSWFLHLWNFDSNAIFTGIPGVRFVASFLQDNNVNYEIKICENSFFIFVLIHVMMTLRIKHLDFDQKKSVKLSNLW